MLAALARLPVTLFAIDEAHCISQWGPAFRPEYEDLCRTARALPRGVPIAALTATADRVTREDIAERLFGGEVLQCVLGFDPPQHRALGRDETRLEAASCAASSRATRARAASSYCLSRRKTEETAALLAADGVRALAYHAGMDKEDREAHQNRFMTDPGVVIVATIAFGMGIDKAGRALCVPHRPAGQASRPTTRRSGGPGATAHPPRPTWLYGLGDIRMRRQFIEDEDAGEERKRREHKRLDALSRLLRGAGLPPGDPARLLRGAGPQPAATATSVSIPPSGVGRGPRMPGMILSAVRRSGERFGAAHVIDYPARYAGPRRSPASAMIGCPPSASARRGARTNGARSSARWWRRASCASTSRASEGSRSRSRGRTLLRGDGVFLYREDSVAACAPSAPRERRGKDAEGPLGDDERALLDVLKALRLELARERGVPAYIVFPRPHPHRHGAPPPAHRGGVRRGQRRGRGEAPAIRGALPGRHRGGSLQRGVRERLTGQSAPSTLLAEEAHPGTRQHVAEAVADRPQAYERRDHHQGW